MAVTDWKYTHANGWQALEADVFADLPEKTTHEEFLCASGYSPSTTYGVNDSPAISLWRSSDAGWLVFIDFFDQWDYVVAPELPDVIELLAKLAPLAHAQLLGELAIKSEKIDVIAEDHEARTHKRKIREQRDRRQTKA